jgi:predicted  nucleic acid-binding Zn-ribbon protein
MQLSTSILEARILSQENDFPGFLSINRCAEKLQILKNNINDDTSYVVESFAKEILYFKLEMGKLNRNFRTCDSEILNYQTTANNVDNEIQKTRDEILKLQSDLINQQGIRKHRENLEEIAKSVNMKENRTSLKRKICTVEDGLKNLDDSIALADCQLQTRAKQFDALMQSISVLQNQIIEEGDEKNVEILELEADGDDNDLHNDDN